MTDIAIPAEAWPLGYFLQEEMNARYWTATDVAARMGGKNDRERTIDFFVVNAILYIDDPKLLLDRKTADKLAAAFGVDPEYFINLDKAWRDWCAAKEKA